MKIIKNESELSVLLPILGQEKYLKVKSSQYGWFVLDSCVLPFFLDKRAIFIRMVFTTEVIVIKGKLTTNTEKKFLNNVVDYVKKHKLCDLIFKAQSNVVFNTCPKESICVPWGTYEVNINISDEELFNSFDGKCRNVIRKAKKEGVEVQTTQNIDLIYNNIKETLERQNSIHYPSRNYIDSLKNNLQNNVVFLAAMKNSIIQGSLIVVYDNNVGYAMYAGSIKSPQTGSLDLLHYEAMKYLQNENVAIYDFVGTRINIKKNSKQAGIDKFKKKFKPVLREGYSFKTIINPFKYRLYILVSKVYLRLKGYKYSDPIIEIKAETTT